MVDNRHWFKSKYDSMATQLESVEAAARKEFVRVWEKSAGAGWRRGCRGRGTIIQMSKAVVYPIHPVDVDATFILEHTFDIGVDLLDGLVCATSSLSSKLNRVSTENDTNGLIIIIWGHVRAAVRTRC
jgi:hypothetical protein